MATPPPPSAASAAASSSSPWTGWRWTSTATPSYPGTQITGTATQNGANVNITATVQNQTFNITLTGGLPYIKVDGTVTGNGSDHAFLVDFRLPIDANGWTWGNRVNQPQTVNTGTSNWYFASGVTHLGLHPYLSVNPYGSITRYGSGSGSADMGLSLAPLFYPPAACALEYNGNGGFWIDFELGTTSKTTKHPNTADFHFVLYQNSPKWGNRSTVQRYQSFFPDYFNRTVSGGNWYVSPSPKTNIPPTPSDFRFKFAEGGGYDDSFSQQWGTVSRCVYTEPWCWHVWSEDPNMVWPETYDIPANFVRSGLSLPWNPRPLQRRNRAGRFQLGGLDCRTGRSKVRIGPTSGRTITARAGAGS